MSSEKGRVAFDIDGEQIKLDPEYSIGPIGIFDVFNVIVHEAQNMELYKWAVKLTKQFDFSLYFDKLVSGDPFTVYVAVASVVFGLLILYHFTNFITGGVASNTGDGGRNGKDKLQEEEKEPPRDFTIEQLREFDGGNDKPIYIGLCGEVFDVSKASDFYGLGSSYHCFAGRNATRAMAKLSFEEEDLCNNRVDDLGPFERSTLEDWYDKFRYYKNYPIVGRYSYPPTGKEFTKEELLALKSQTASSDPSRVDPPIYMAIKGQVLDVSYGGMEMYGPDGPYYLFAGRDASRALAKMSFSPSDVESSDLSDLSPDQLKVLDDWEKKFIQTKKYPVVGRLV